MKRLLIFYSHYFPAYKAGGPIQSIRNMVELIRDDFEISIVCSAYDLGEAIPLKGIAPDQWNKLEKNVQVMYIGRGAIKSIVSAFNQVKPDVAYINGIFLPVFSWCPWVIARRKNIPVVFTPRGMLQDGALANGSVKKLLAISFIRALRLPNKTLWHATDEQEKRDVLKRIGRNADVTVVGNVPKSPLLQRKKPAKRKGELRLAFLSLIARKKNLDLVLTHLKSVRKPISLDIYGPVKDADYWKECLRLSLNQIHEIRYHGPVSPDDVQRTFSQYHALVLFTKGENFGHVIYESLSSGTPAILSQFTPWGRLQDRSAGITVDINDSSTCTAAIEEFLSLDQEQFDRLSEGAFKLAREYYDNGNFRRNYVELFSGCHPAAVLPQDDSSVLKPLTNFN